MLESRRRHEGLAPTMGGLSRLKGSQTRHSFPSILLRRTLRRPGGAVDCTFACWRIIAALNERSVAGLRRRAGLTIPFAAACIRVAPIQPTSASKRPEMTKGSPSRGADHAEGAVHRRADHQDFGRSEGRRGISAVGMGSARRHSKHERRRLVERTSLTPAI